MGFRTTLVLIIIGALLAGFFIFVEPRLKGTSPEKIILIEKEMLQNISKIVIKRGEQEIVCQRKETDVPGELINEIWEITRPIKARMGEYPISNMLDNIKDIDVMYVMKGDDLDKYGLDKPQLVLTVHSPPHVFTLKIGKGSELQEGAVYLQKAGQPTVYLVHESLLKAFDRDVKEIRYKEIVDYKTSDIKRIRIARRVEGAEEEYEFALRPEGGWYLQKPFEARMDDGKVSRLITDLEGLEADDFFPKPKELKEVHLDPPAWRFEVFEKPREGTEKRYVIVFSDPLPDQSDKMHGYRTGAEEVAILEVRKFNAFPKKLSELRERSIFDIKSEMLRSITIVTRLGETWLFREEREVEKEKGKKEKEFKWVLREPEGVKIDEAKVGRFVNKLLDMEVEDFKERQASQELLANYGLTNPSCKLTIGFEKTKGILEAKTYLISSISEDGPVYFKCDKEPPIYTISPSDYRYIFNAELNFMDDVLFVVPKLHIKRLIVEIMYKSIGGKELRDSYVCKFSEEKKGWIFEQPPHLEVDPQRIQDALSESSLIRAEELITKDILQAPRYGLIPPHLKLTIQYEKEAAGVKRTQEKILCMSPTAQERRWYARFLDSLVIFEIDSDLPRLLRTGVHVGAVPDKK
jgi:hypothetical protein